MNWDDTTLAPDVTPDASDRPTVRTVTHVTGGGPVQFGAAVQFEFAFDDGRREMFRATCGDLPKIVGTLRGYASITERASRASPDRPVEVINPFQATDVRTDRVGPMIVARLPTTDGLPLLIAMDASVAEKLMLGLERELARGPRR